MPTIATHRRLDPSGRLVEYRRYPADPTILFLQSRVLQPDGTPFGNRWYHVSDTELLRLGRYEPDLLDLLEGKTPQPKPRGFMCEGGPDCGHEAGEQGQHWATDYKPDPPF